MLAVALLPLATAAAWLVATLAGAPLDSLAHVAAVVLPLVLGAGLVAGAVAARWTDDRGAIGLIPCVLVPLAVLGSWCVVPGPGGVGGAGFGYFVDWVTRYPTAGPFNLDVLLGMLCVLGASGLPVAFALYRVRAGTPDRRVLAALFALFLIPYVAVLVHLDVGLLVVGGLSVGDDVVYASLLGSGALLRAAAAIGMIVAIAVRR